MCKVVINDNGLHAEVIVNNDTLTQRTFEDRTKVLPWVYMWRDLSLDLGHEVEVNHNW